MRVTDMTGVDPACNANVGESVTTDDNGPMTEKHIDDIITLTVVTEHTHPVCLDLNTVGANAYIVCKWTGMCPVTEVFVAIVDTATGAFNLLPLVVSGPVEESGMFHETGSTKN